MYCLGFPPHTGTRALARVTTWQASPGSGDRPVPRSGFPGVEVFSMVTAVTAVTAVIR